MSSSGSEVITLFSKNIFGAPIILNMSMGNVVKELYVKLIVQLFTNLILSVTVMLLIWLLSRLKEIRLSRTLKYRMNLKDFKPKELKSRKVILP
jgi:hypothetical protein